MIRKKNPQSNNKWKFTPLHKAAEYGHQSVCEFFINHTGIQDKNPPDYEGTTPAHLAAENGHFKTCMVILHKLDKIERDTSGLSPLMHAYMHTNIPPEDLKLIAWRKRTIQESPYERSWCGLIIP